MTVAGSTNVLAAGILVIGTPIWLVEESSECRRVIERLSDEPGYPRGLSIKRVTSRDPVDPARWWVERDNEREGVDSWQVGGLAERDVLATVLGRLPGWVPAWVYGSPSPPR